MCVFYELDHKRLESCSFTSKSADLFLLGTFCKKMMKSKEDRLIVPIVYLSVFLQIHVTVVTAILQEGLGAKWGISAFYLILQESQDRF